MLTLEIAPADVEQMLYQSVVDAEFRADFSAALFGGGSWPEAIESQERALLDVALAGTDAYMCSTTCSSGPFTLVCDGSTK